MTQTELVRAFMSVFDKYGHANAAERYYAQDTIDDMIASMIADEDKERKGYTIIQRAYYGIIDGKVVDLDDLRLMPLSLSLPSPETKADSVP